MQVSDFPIRRTDLRGLTSARAPSSPKASGYTDALSPMTRSTRYGEAPPPSSTSQRTAR